MNDKIKVSILCLTYNHEKYIGKTIDGFLRQKTNFPIEIIIHDDCSTDNTPKIIEEYKNRFPDKIKIIQQKENQYSKNIGIMRTYVEPVAKGKYIALCEGDDFWTSEDKLQKQIDYMEQHEDCVCTYHAVNYIRDNKIVGNDISFKKECDVDADTIIAKGGLFCATLSLVYRNGIINDYPKFREMADIGDYPKQILLALRGKVHYFPEIMGCYRFFSIGSWTETINKNISKNIKHWKTEIEWMEELDKYTNYKYSNSIYYHLINYSIINLYLNKCIDKKIVRTYFKKIKFSSLKIRCYISFYKRLIKANIKKMMKLK